MSAAPRLDLRSAAEAAKVLDAIIEQGDALPAETLRRLKSLPAMLQTSGLAATLAFYAAKSGPDGLGLAYRVVGDRLRSTAAASLGIENVSPGRFFTELASKDPVAVTLATAEIRALATWLARLAEAVDKDRPPNERAAADKSSTADNGGVADNGGAAGEGAAATGAAGRGETAGGKSAADAGGGAR